MFDVGGDIAAVVAVSVADAEVVRVAEAAEVGDGEVAVCGVRTVAYPG